MRSFLRLTKSKLFLFLFLILIASFIPDTDEVCVPSDQGTSCHYDFISGIGYPTFFGEGFEGGVKIKNIFYPVSFIVNIVIYYLTAAIFIFLFNIRNRKIIYSLNGLLLISAVPYICIFINEGIRFSKLPAAIVTILIVFSSIILAILSFKKPTDIVVQRAVLILLVFNVALFVFVLTVAVNSFNTYYFPA